jgi:hypothetical protein
MVLGFLPLPFRLSVPANVLHSIALLTANRKWSSKPNVLDIALAQGDNQFLVKLTNVSEDWSLSLKLTDLGGNAILDVNYSAL